MGVLDLEIPVSKPPPADGETAERQGRSDYYFFFSPALDPPPFGFFPLLLLPGPLSPITPSLPQQPVLMRGSFVPPPARCKPALPTRLSATSPWMLGPLELD